MGTIVDDGVKEEEEELTMGWDGMGCDGVKVKSDKGGAGRRGGCRIEPGR